MFSFLQSVIHNANEESVVAASNTCSRLFTGFSTAMGIEWFTNVNVVATVTVPRLLDFLGFKLSPRQHFSWSRSRCSNVLEPRLSSDLKMVVSPMKAFSCDILWFVVKNRNEKSREVLTVSAIFSCVSHILTACNII